MFSKSCEYAIRATLFVAANSTKGRRTGLEEIAKSIESPEAFTSKILQHLVEGGILESYKGPGGGFFMSEKSASETMIASIVTSVDGNVLIKCSLGLSECSDHQPCPLHSRYKAAKEKLQEVYGLTSVSDLTAEIIGSKTYLKL